MNWDGRNLRLIISTALQENELMKELKKLLSNNSVADEVVI